VPLRVTRRSGPPAFAQIGNSAVSRLATTRSRFLQTRVLARGRALCGTRPSTYFGVRARGANRFSSGDKTQGASTSPCRPPQLVPQPRQRPIGRQAAGNPSTYRMEHEFTKQAISGLICHVIFSGRCLRRVAAAAEAFFGKSSTSLSKPRPPPSPGFPSALARYNPIRSQLATSRRAYVRGGCASWLDTSMPATAEARQQGSAAGARSTRRSHDVAAPTWRRCQHRSCAQRFGSPNSRDRRLPPVLNHHSRATGRRRPSRRARRIHRVRPSPRLARARPGRGPAGAGETDTTNLDGEYARSPPSPAIGCRSPRQECRADVKSLGPFARFEWDGLCEDAQAARQRKRSGRRPRMPARLLEARRRHLRSSPMSRACAS